MPITFTPNGKLNIATDSVDLPQETKDNLVVSGAMLRCTNLSLDRMGIASTRAGSHRINTSALSGAISTVIEQGGVRYAFTGLNIYRNETSLEQILRYVDWSAALYNPYNVVTQAVYALNGTDRKKIEGSTVYEWGIERPSIAPTISKGSDYACATAADQVDLTASNWLFTQAAAGGYYCTFQWEVDMLAGNESLFPETAGYCSTYHFEALGGYAISGKYEFCYTYARYDGATLICESNPSDVTNAQIESQAKVTWTASADAQVTHVRVYRSLMDLSGAWYLMGTYDVADLSATVVGLDEDLGAEVLTNHDRPPLGTQVIGPSLGGQLYILKDNLLYYCLPQQPEYWPDNYYLEVTPPQFPIKAACFFGGNLYLASEHEIFLVSGSSSASYFAQPMAAVTGTKAKHCFVSAKGHGIFHLGSDGIYLYSALGKDTCLSDSQFKPLFEGETVGSLPGWNKWNIAQCIMKIYQNKLWFGYPAVEAEYCKNFLVIDLETGRATHHQYPVVFKCLAIDHQNNRLLGGTTGGYVYVLDVLDAPTDAGTVISWDLQSKEFTQFQKYFPRYARWDVDLGFNGTATGEVLLEGTVKQTHQITADRQTKKRHVATCTGKRLSVRVHGTGPVDIYGVEVE